MLHILKIGHNLTSRKIYFEIQKMSIDSKKSPRKSIKAYY